MQPALALPEALASFWEQSRRRIDESLARAVSYGDGAPPELERALHYSLTAPGKRIRGTLVLATAEMLRGPLELALGLACAIEMVHASSLILDDLPCMDNATLRRGRPVVHRAMGEANAILAAVALLNAAYGQIQQVEGLTDRQRRQISERLSRAVGAHGLIGGQVADLAATGKTLDLEQLEWVHRHKTGALFVAAVEIGAWAGGARPRKIEALARYAKNLGLAFQITDDLLDAAGPETTGKDAGLDRDKTTFVALCGNDGARRLVDELIDSALAALHPFGLRRSDKLRALAEFVRCRDR